MPAETLDPTSSVAMWDNTERRPLETAAFEQREIIFEQKFTFQVGIYFVGLKPNPFSYFSWFICKQFELIFSKPRLVA